MHALPADAQTALVRAVGKLLDIFAPESATRRVVLVLPRIASKLQFVALNVPQAMSAVEAHLDRLIAAYTHATHEHVEGDVTHPQEDVGS